MEHLKQPVPEASVNSPEPTNGSPNSGSPINLGPTLLMVCAGQAVSINDYRAIGYAYRVKMKLTALQIDP